MEFTKFLRTPNLRSENDCFWNLFFHLDSPFLINHTSGSNWYICFSFAAWKVSKIGVFSGPYFPVFRLNTKIYSVIRRFTIWTLFTQCFCIIIYNLVYQYSLHYYWYCYNQKQSYSSVLQKRCSYKFRKIHKKTLKKRLRHRCFLVNSAKFPITLFLKNALDGCFGINTRHVYCPTLTFCLFKNDIMQNFWLSIFFGLICRLGTRMSSIFQALSQKSIFNPVEHLQLSFFGKNSLQLKTVKYFRKKAQLWCSTRF